MQALTALTSELLGRLVCNCLALPQQSAPQVALELLTGQGHLCIRGWLYFTCLPALVNRLFLTPGCSARLLVLQLTPA